MLSCGTPWLLRGPSLPTCPCLCVLISDWKITGSLVRPPLAPVYTQEGRGEEIDPVEPFFDAAVGSCFSPFFLADRRSRPQGTAAGSNRNVFARSVTAVGLCVYVEEPDLMGLPSARLPASGRRIAAIHACI